MRNFVARVSLKGARILSAVLKNHVYVMRFGLAQGFKRRFGFGSRIRFRLKPEERFLQALDLTGKTVYDLGAFIGYYAMFFARQVGSAGCVYAFEPNARNFNEATFNVGLNHLDNVQLFHLGLGATSERLTFVVDGDYPARGTFDPARQAAACQQHDPERLVIEVDSLDHIIQEKKLKKPDFIKIDVEGFEDQVLAGMENTLSAHHPDLFIEMHGHHGREVLTRLRQADYEIHHVETNEPVDPKQLDVTGGHLYCVHS